MGVVLSAISLGDGGEQQQFSAVSSHGQDASLESALLLTNHASFMGNYGRPIRKKPYLPSIREWHSYCIYNAGCRS
jgi:hypothetical protein